MGMRELRGAWRAGMAWAPDLRAITSSPSRTECAFKHRIPSMVAGPEARTHTDGRCGDRKQPLKSIFINVRTRYVRIPATLIGVWG